ncbi:MAG: phosphate ABC transporter permease subunit PstC [Campylobacterales bacterium]
MEELFKRLSLGNALLILVILVAIFGTLFIFAKPAIDAYGLKFLVDPRWGVMVDSQTKTPSPSFQTQQGGINIEEDDLGEIGPQPTPPSLQKSTPSPQSPVNVEEDDLGDLTPPTPQNSSTSAQNLSTKGAPSTKGEGGPKVVYGGLVPLVGTILSTAIALIFAVPIALGIAIFLTEIAPPFIEKPVGIAIELLAAIPSIIYGMWGLFYFGPLIAELFGGSSVSLLVAGLVLGIMIIPFIASLSRDAMLTTPGVLKESAYAVGATKFEVIKDVIFPYAKRGIIGSIILALGRALGETMAVAFVIGGVFSLPKSLTDPTISIPVVLANNFAESSGIALSALFYLALILFLLSFGIITYGKFKFLSNRKG